MVHIGEDFQLALETNLTLAELQAMSQLVIFGMKPSRTSEEWSRDNTEIIEFVATITEVDSEQCLTTEVSRNVNRELESHIGAWLFRNYVVTNDNKVHKGDIYELRIGE